MGIFDMFGGSVVKSIESIAKELIETDMESAEAKALMVKTLDPSGLMRRDISMKVSNMYVAYIALIAILVLAQSFSIGDRDDVYLAIESLKELFLPVTSLFGIIVTASFGVNGMNSYKGK